MNIDRIVAGEYRCNNYVVSNNGKAILIEASLGLEKLKNVLDKRKATLEAVFITHAHFDHILTLDEIMKEYNVPCYLSEVGYDYLNDPNKNVSNICENPVIITEMKNIKKLHDNEKIQCLDGNFIEAFSTPGHCESSMCYKLEDLLFTGDTIFAGTCGRVDLWNSNVESMIDSLIKISKIKNIKIYYPGHGYSFNEENMKNTVLNMIKVLN